MVDVVVPGAWSSDGLAATLASLASQRYPAFKVVSARPPGDPGTAAVPAMRAILKARGHPVQLADLPTGITSGRRRQALVEGTAAPYVLVVDDGVFLEPDLLGRMVAAIRATRCGFVGSAPIDLRYSDEHRPDEQAIEFWDGPVRPEEIRIGTRAWARRRIHRGANLEHLRERLPRTRDRLYRIADIGGCVLYDMAALRAAGGFAAPDRSGTVGPLSLESAAQLRVLAKAGGAGLFPSGAYRLTPASTPRIRAPLGTEGGRDGRGLGPRWIRRAHRLQHAPSRSGSRTGRRQIRAPGLPHRQVATRPAGGPRDS